MSAEPGRRHVVYQSGPAASPRPAWLLGAAGLALLGLAWEVVARLAWEINRRQDDIGARRLHTLMEWVLEGVLFDAPDVESGAIAVTVDLVNERVGDIADDEDVSLYIV